MSSSFLRPFKFTAPRDEAQYSSWKIKPNFQFFAKYFFLEKNLILQSSASESNSVHLALTQRSVEEPDHQASNVLEIYEAVDENSNKSVATIADDKYLAIFASQYHGISNPFFRKVSILRSCAPELSLIIDAARSGK